MPNIKHCLAGIVVLALVSGRLLTQEPAKADDAKKPAAAKEGAKKLATGDKAETKKPATHKVEKKPFRIELIAKGVLEPAQTAEIAFRPQPTLQPLPGPFTIGTIVAHGKAVKQGEVLAVLKTEKLEQMIDDLQAEKSVLEASLKLAEEELPAMEKSAPVELAAAQRDRKVAAEDQKYFTEIERGEQEKQAHYSVRTAGFSVEYAKEELHQLEKMYKANDLTEETEQIILKRQRHYLEQAQFWFKQAEIRRDYTLNVILPRREVALDQQVVKTSLALQKLQQTLVPAINQRKQSLTKLRHEREKITGRLASLEKDRAAMTMRAPMDGIVYYGKFSAGQWTGAGPGKLAVHSAVSPDDVFMTVIKPRPVELRWLIDEKDAGLVKSGLEGTARFAFHPDLKVAAKVSEVAGTPAAPGQFAARITLLLGAGDDALHPGMAATVKFIPYSKSDAIAVPASAVFEEEYKHLVYVVDAAGKHQDREVTPGRTFGNRTEILHGLQPGEEILLERPDGKDGKNTPAKEAPAKEGAK